MIFSQHSSRRYEWRAYEDLSTFDKRMDAGKPRKSDYVLIGLTYVVVLCSLWLVLAV